MGTSFPVINEQPVQYVHPYQPISLPFVDVQHLADQEREVEALRLAAEDAERPFDLASGPLLRPLLIRLNDTDTRLFLTLHHIIFDGFSLYQIFLPEISAIYEAFLAELPSPLPDLPIRYVDFAIWQREQIQRTSLLCM